MFPGQGDLASLPPLHLGHNALVNFPKFIAYDMSFSESILGSFWSQLLATLWPPSGHLACSLQGSSGTFQILGNTGPRDFVNFQESALSRFVFVLCNFSDPAPGPDGFQDFANFQGRGG